MLIVLNFNKTSYRQSFGVFFFPLVTISEILERENGNVLAFLEDLALYAPFRLRKEVLFLPPSS